MDFEIFTMLTDVGAAGSPPKAHWFGFFQYLSIQDISGLNLLCFLKSQFRTLRTIVITAEEIFFSWLPMKTTLS
jgi:hypothetical protein